MTGIVAQNVARASGLIKTASGGSGGVWTLIKTLTASSSSTLSFVDGASDVTFDSTYPIYRCVFINVHPSNDEAYLTFQGSDDTTNYGIALTSTYFYASHDEGDTATSLSYDTGSDLAQSTDFHKISQGIGNGNDESCSGEMWLFSPSSTTFAKHFISRSSTYEDSNKMYDVHTGGYINTTAAIEAIQFKMTAGNIDTGTFKLYGLGDS